MPFRYEPVRTGSQLRVDAVPACGHTVALSAEKVSRPRDSREVADLESQLKARLLVRSTRKLEVTEVGAAYFDTCKRILKQV